MSSAKSALNRTLEFYPEPGHRPALPVGAARGWRRGAAARPGSPALATATATRPAAITTGAAPTPDATWQLRYASGHTGLANRHRQGRTLLALERYAPGRGHAVQPCRVGQTHRALRGALHGRHPDQPPAGRDHAAVCRGRLYRQPPLPDQRARRRATAGYSRRRRLPGGYRTGRPEPAGVIGRGIPRDARQTTEPARPGAGPGPAQPPALGGPHRRRRPRQHRGRVAHHPALAQQCLALGPGPGGG